eukprot:scaffold4291_cov256-Pinguiococcus_pyrenoidosus.AAC.5
MAFARSSRRGRKLAVICLTLCQACNGLRPSPARPARPQSPILASSPSFCRRQAAALALGLPALLVGTPARSAEAAAADASVVESWGQSWSRLDGKVAPSAPLALPQWLEGEWAAQASLAGVDFPLGRKFLTEKLPGVRMASILWLPNVGNNPSFRVRFQPLPGVPGSCQEDQAFNAKAVVGLTLQCGMLTTCGSHADNMIAADGGLLAQGGRDQGGGGVAIAARAHLCRTNEGGKVPVPARL